MPKSRHVLAVVAVGLLVAAGCSSSDDETTQDTQADTTTSSVSEAATTLGASSAEADPEAADGSAEVDASTQDDTADLTATDTGVTATTIKIAAVFPDVTAIGREPGDVEAKFRVAVEAVNDAGGVNGREIELVFSLYEPIGNAEADALCVRNVDDEGVFAVVGVLLRETALCYTELNDTIAINTFPTTSDQFERSQAPLIGVDPLPQRLVEANVEALLNAGHLAPGLRVAVHGLASKEDLHNAYVEVLRARDIDVVASTLRTIDNDVIAAENEVAITAERWVANDAEALLGSAPESATDFVGAYTATGLGLPMLLPENSSNEPSLIQDALGYDIDNFRFAVALVRDTDPGSLYADNIAGVADCVDSFEAATGEAVNVNAAEDGLDNLASTVSVCQSIDIFAAIAEAAGADLTTESFAAAAESYGPIEVTGVVEGSLGPGKLDISDTPPSIATYDSETLQFVAS